MSDGRETASYIFIPHMTDKLMTAASEPTHLSALKLGFPSSLLPQIFALLPLLLVVLQLNIGLGVTSAI